jgi:hypothetical protein
MIPGVVVMARLSNKDTDANQDIDDTAYGSRPSAGTTLWSGTLSPPVMAGLDPAIHLLREILVKMDGCAGLART